MAAADLYIPSLKGGLGISATMEDYGNGKLKTSYINLMYAQHIQWGEHLLVIPSIRLSYIQKSLNVTALHFGEPIDPRSGIVWTGTPMPAPRKTHGDLSAGALINFRKNFYFGVYCFHLTQPDEGLLGSNKLHSQLAFYGSYNYHVSATSVLQVAVRVEGQNGYWYNQVNLNAVFYKHLVTGVGLTSLEGGTFNLGCRMDYFNVIGSYNIFRSQLSTQAVSTWEINAALTIRNKENRHKLANFENW